MTLHDSTIRAEILQKLSDETNLRTYRSPHKHTALLALLTSDAPQLPALRQLLANCDPYLTLDKIVSDIDDDDGTEYISGMQIDLILYFYLNIEMIRVFEQQAPLDASNDFLEEIVSRGADIHRAISFFNDPGENALPAKVTSFADLMEAAKANTIANHQESGEQASQLLDNYLTETEKRENCWHHTPKRHFMYYSHILLLSDGLTRLPLQPEKNKSQQAGDFLAITKELPLLFQTRIAALTQVGAQVTAGEVHRVERELENQKSLDDALRFTLRKF